MQSFDVIVLGLGAMGAAAADECARRGLRVLGLEQFPLGHDRGSSHGETRVIRQAYYEHPDYVPLLLRAYDRWYELEQICGRQLYTECGVLSLSPPGGEVVAGVLQAAQTHQLPVEALDQKAIRERFPEFHVPGDYTGAWESRAGYLLVEECVQAHLNAARGLGAELRSEEPVLSWREVGGSIEVETTRDHYSAGRLIITAGPWAGEVLSQLGLPLQVLRKPLLWFGVTDPARLRRDRFPIYMVESSQGFYYGFPVINQSGHKVARHDGGTVVNDPLSPDRDLLPNDESDCRRFLEQFLPAAAGPMKRYAICLYTVTPDRHFVIDHHPHTQSVVLAAGFSGHGFKFASVVGEILADLTELGRTSLPIERFQLARFR